jgi:hypothetical protein
MRDDPSGAIPQRAITAPAAARAPPSAARERASARRSASSIPMERELTSPAPPQDPAPACQARISSGTSAKTVPSSSTGNAPTPRPPDRRAGRAPPRPRPSPCSAGRRARAAARPAARRNWARGARTISKSAAPRGAERARIPEAGEAVAVRVDAHPVLLGPPRARKASLRLVRRGEARAGALEPRVGVEADGGRPAGPPVRRREREGHDVRPRVRARSGRRRDRPPGTRPPPRRLGHEARRALQHDRRVEQVALLPRPPDQLQPQRQALRVEPAGTAMPGSPARFTVTVKTSLRYICTGSASAISPSPKAADGVAGVRIASTPARRPRRSRA